MTHNYFASSQVYFVETGIELKENRSEMIDSSEEAMLKQISHQICLSYIFKNLLVKLPQSHGKLEKTEPTDVVLLTQNGC